MKNSEIWLCYKCCEEGGNGLTQVVPLAWSTAKDTETEKDTARLPRDGVRRSWVTEWSLENKIQVQKDPGLLPPIIPRQSKKHLCAPRRGLSTDTPPAGNGSGNSTVRD